MAPAHVPARILTLGQVVAVEKAARQGANKTTAALYADVQKPELVSGFVQTLNPDIQPEDGRILKPDQGKRLQLRTEHAILELARLLTPAIDLAAAKDYANCTARGDVIIGGEVILEAVPVTLLLWLEHQLTEVLTFFKGCQEVDPKEEWTWDPSSDAFRSQVEHRICADKKTVSLVLIEPTQHHPGQAQAISADTRIGMWEITKFSGALLPQRRRELIERGEAMVAAVKQAREAANHEPAPGRDIASRVFGFLLGT